MKKLFIMLALLVSGAVFASETAVKNTIIAYRKADAMFDSSAMEYISPDFAGFALGKKINRTDLQRIYQCVNIMMMTNDLEVFMENAFLMQGQKLNDALRQEIRDMKNTEEGRRQLQQGKAQLEMLKKAADLGMKNLVFKNCRVIGRTAYAEVEAKDPNTGMTGNVKYTLVKRKGKWLISGMNVSIAK